MYHKSRPIAEKSDSKSNFDNIEANEAEKYKGHGDHQAVANLSTTQEIKPTFALTDLGVHVIKFIHGRVDDFALVVQFDENVLTQFYLRRHHIPQSFQAFDHIFRFF